MKDKIYSIIYEEARRQERDRVREFIDQIKNDISGAPFFLNIFAPSGFGRTAFLELIWKDYERVLPSSFIHAGKFREKNNTNIRELLLDIIHDLVESLPKRGTFLPSDYVARNEEDLAYIVINLVRRSRDYEKVVLLLVDDYDLIFEEQRRWLQGNVLSPISQTGKVAVILSSETEIRFTENFELRMRLACRELESLDPETMSRVFPKYENIVKEIYDITGGLPTPTEKFIEQLEISNITSASDFQSHAQNLTQTYYRSYVDQNILGNIESNLRETILILSLLRRFDVKVLREILPDLLPKLYNKYGTADYLDLIDRLRPWVQWRRQGGYTLNHALRLMLEGYILTLRPELHKKVHQILEILYSKWLKEEYSESNFIELLYHLFSSHKTEKTKKPISEQIKIYESKISGKLQAYLQEDGGRQLNADELDSLRNSLDQDDDLKRYIPEESRNLFREMINQRIIETNEKR
jgi:hypothetical protein